MYILTGISKSYEAIIYHNIHSWLYLFRLQHHHTAQNSVQLGDVLPVMKKVCKTLDFLYLSQFVVTYLGFNSRLASPGIWPYSLYCTGTAPTHDDNRHRRCISTFFTRIFGSVRNLHGTTYLRIGHLWRRQYVFISRESAQHKRLKDPSIIYRRTEESSKDRYPHLHNHYDLCKCFMLVFHSFLVILFE